jgi:hypothetical protein
MIPKAKETPEALYEKLEKHFKYQVEYKRGFAKNYFDKIMRLRQKKVRNREKFILEIILGFEWDLFNSQFQRRQAYGILGEYFTLSTRYNIDFLDYLAVHLNDPVVQAMCQVSRYLVGITYDSEKDAVMCQLEYLKKYDLAGSFEKKVRARDEL